MGLVDILVQGSKTLDIREPVSRQEAAKTGTEDLSEIEELLLVLRVLKVPSDSVTRGPGPLPSRGTKTMT